MKENDVVNAICEYLALKRYLFFRVNNTGLAMKTEEGFRYRRMSKYSRPGVPDIILVREGQFIGIEAKTDKGRLSPHQEEFRRDCEANGALYLVARSIEDIQKAGL